METAVDVEMLRLYERAARIYCGHAGLQPDVNVPLPHPTIVGTAMLRPVWACVAIEMHDLTLKMRSIRQAAEEDQTVDAQSKVIIQ